MSGNIYASVKVIMIWDNKSAMFVFLTINLGFVLLSYAVSIDLLLAGHVNAY